LQIYPADTWISAQNFKSKVAQNYIKSYRAYSSHVNAPKCEPIVHLERWTHRRRLPSELVHTHSTL
jgi:hypothetical protein